jgi:aldehyde:ferredoxin oxidoreductase
MLGIIDLTKDKITIEEPALELRKKLLGGRGMNVWYWEVQHHGKIAGDRFFG